MGADADASDGQLNEMDTTTSPAHAEANLSEPDVEGVPSACADHEVAEGDLQDYDAAVADEASVSATTRDTHLRLLKVAGIALVVVMAAIVGWLGFRAYQVHQAEAQRQLFLQIGRQTALNLTTIDWQHAEEDVQRLLESATGQFHDQFSQRKQPFIDVVKKVQSKSVGAITEAGLESDSKSEAQVLVSVSITSSNLGGADQPPRQWRMRISVEKSGDDVKVSNVTFVP